jgi:ABC-type transporter Mla subunit MlaD
MAASTHFKLGLFTLAGIAGAIAAAFGLGVHRVGAERVAYHAYFDESVQGLEPGSPVKYRGVKIGRVGAIRIAPDRRHVDVELAIERRDADRLALAAPPPGLRAQLGSQGITGVKYVDLELFEPADAPAPALSFAPAARHLPSRRSLMKGLELQLESVGRSLPQLLDRAHGALAVLDGLFADVRVQRLPEHVAAALRGADGAVTDLRRWIRNVDRAGLPDRAAALIEGLTAAAGKLDAAIERVGGDAGLVSSARRATDAIGDLGREALGGAAELERTMRDLGDAARALRELAEMLERDPDTLLRGRAKVREP